MPEPKAQRQARNVESSSKFSQTFENRASSLPFRQRSSTMKESQTTMAVAEENAEAYRRQEELGRPLRKTADAREAQRAFVEKRKPVFRGA